MSIRVGVGGEGVERNITKGQTNVIVIDKASSLHVYINTLFTAWRKAIRTILKNPFRLEVTTCIFNKLFP